MDGSDSFRPVWYEEESVLLSLFVVYEACPMIVHDRFGARRATQLRENNLRMTHKNGPIMKFMQ